MNTRINQTEAALMMPMPANAQAERIQALRQQALQQSDSGIGRWFRSLTLRLSEGLQRRRAMAELQELTDRELADIGLVRSDIPHLFDRMAQQEQKVATQAPVSRPANDFNRKRAAA
ncbi:putative cytosolic protein [Roseomonas mucosa]|jgi:uncharacterized protein YjiS (DUF1127 family)|uniref:Uncharacterized conserved small protein n=1 Tax=Roseomonas mucosa TaxID=207340 RepID=A0A1S8D5S9_9PROT|nr:MULTISPECIES: DUF1127 domain-containing protein [Roseomonas]MBS5902461.1 DUF1127 domain-containing protein [Acetobacteraceae bacterium]ATR22880.1 DUF1127 domain-containing protein [Roseomonas sp. FDAARGOS_362]AWV24079.1 putative cytosolic protein [Roseomonas mucosa]MCG7353330.1 DUF1127 domain-containing protein [Roseomonas mucosa]MCG7356971.1 DUF1127 domain-containing protein [Roseomonas mucosa]